MSAEKQANTVASAVKKQAEKVVSEVFKSSYAKTFGMDTLLVSIMQGIMEEKK